MKRNTILMIFAMAPVFAGTPHSELPASSPSMFFLGCGLIALMMANLAWKTRKLGK